MKNLLPLFVLVFISANIFAQEQLRSSKILYDQGLEELYELQKMQDGYLALGLKGSEATNKKLWLIKFNNRFEVSGSRIIYNELLENPFKMVQLPNGNTMILAQQIKNNIQQSLLIKLSPDGRVLNAQVFGDAQNVELSDMALVGNELFMYGAKKHIKNQLPSNDKILLIKTNLDAQILWQKEYDLGQVELLTKQLVVDRKGNLLVTGTLINLELAEANKVSNSSESSFLNNEAKQELATQIVLDDKSNGQMTTYTVVEVDNSIDTVLVEDEDGSMKMVIVERVKDQDVVPTVKRNSVKSAPTVIRSFYTFKMNTEGEVLHKMTINNYAQYAYANAMVEHNGGYLFAINPANYFGDGLLVQTDRDLNITEKSNINGTPIIFSGIQKHKDKIILGGIFSNTFNDYSPGFVVLDKDLKVQQAKTDKSLFKHFFITNMTDLDEGHFMLNGIGYEQGKASDIYFLPFTTSGQSSCDLKSYDVSNTALASNLDAHYFTNFSTSASSVQTQNAEFQLADENGFESGNICTTPDQEPISKDKNQTWSQWRTNNSEVFDIKIPTDWVQVSPNPSPNGKFMVQYAGLQNDAGLKVSITDLTGRQMQNLFLENQDIFVLDLSMLSPGMYNISIHDGHKSQTKKIEIIK